MVFSDEINANSIAKAVVYPFVAGTSIATSFGTSAQKFIADSEGKKIGAKGSGISGMDIEYIDAVDGRTKYCQIKSGPATINKGDIESIESAFSGLRNLGHTNSMHLQDDDYVLAVLYGEHKDISSMYTTIEKDGYTVLVGEEFWYHLTGIRGVYQDLISIAQKAAQNSNNNMENGVEKLIAKVEKGIKDNIDDFNLN